MIRLRHVAVLLATVVPVQAQLRPDGPNSVTYPIQQAEPQFAAPQRSTRRAYRYRSKSSRKRQQRKTVPRTRYISTQKATWERITRQPREIDYLVFAEEIPNWYLINPKLTAQVVFSEPLRMTDGSELNEIDMAADAGETWEPESFIPFNDKPVYREVRLSEAGRGIAVITFIASMLLIMLVAVPIFWRKAK